ncbi:MAG: SsrA-binding protein SmpB [Proteobacteria bacterium]|nr:SsrA-binding protein SmpB [Pseudomonadota bacterium]
MSQSTGTLIKNRKAYHDYVVLEKFEAGIALVGTEVKSIRAGHVKMLDSFCQINDRYQLELHQMEITQYRFGNIFNHDPTRIRKLLMHKRQIYRLNQTVMEKGLTLIPLRIYFNARGRAKLEIGLCKGKKLHDKRQDMKEKDAKREISRALKDGGY